MSPVSCWKGVSHHKLQAEVYSNSGMESLSQRRNRTAACRMGENVVDEGAPGWFLTYKKKSSTCAVYKGASSSATDKRWMKTE